MGGHVGRFRGRIAGAVGDSDRGSVFDGWDLISGDGSRIEKLALVVVNASKLPLDPFCGRALFKE